MRIFWFCAFSCALSAANFTTYIGEPSATYSVTALTTDSAGNTYATGIRRYSDASTDLFVVRIDPSGNAALLASFDKTPPATVQPLNIASGIAVDSSGEVFVVGTTPLANFPLLDPLQGTPGANGNQTGFLMKLAPDGGLLFSTYLGGTEGPSRMSAVAVDAQGSVYVTGSTASPDYPHTSGLPNDAASSSDIEMISAVWFAKISGDGSAILYAGGISGPPLCGGEPICPLGTTGGAAIAVDPAGNAYVAGNVYGSLTGTAGAAVTAGSGAFVAKVNAAGSGLVYLTLIGSGSGLPGGGPPSFFAPANLVYSIAADAAGEAYITGNTNDPNFPATPGAFQTTLPGGMAAGPITPPSSAFVAKLSPTGSSFLWATFLGGTSFDYANSIAVDSSGDAWVSGTTESADFPVSTGWPGGGEFLAELNSSGSALVYGARFPSEIVAGALAFDSGGALHTAGSGELVSSFSPPSSAFESTAPQIFGMTNATGAGSLSGGVAAAEVISIYGVNLGPTTGVSAALNSQGMVPTTVAGVQVWIDGVAAPLLYVSATQINAVAPVELSLDSLVEMNLTVNGAPAPAFRVAVDSEAPGVFGGVMNQDGTVNSAANPAPGGSFVTVWADNAGAFSPVDGQIASAAQAYCGCTILDEQPVAGAVLPPDSQISVSYAGAAPGLVNGITQINFQIPAYSGPTFQQSFFLETGALVSNGFFVYIRQ